MDTLAGMTRTGEKVAGPASDLVELENDKGLKHLAITFHRKYRQHDAINGEVRNVRGFLEEPGSVEVVGLAQTVPESGAFIYPTGTVVPLQTVLETLSRIGEPGGVKAGLELCYFVAQALEEAAEKGERHGVVTHGDLSPWRIALRNDGQIRILGYGLPQLDMLAFREDGRTMPKEDGYRYCPPERIEGKDEDSSSDLFSLALIAFELMVGEPLYNGVLSEIKQQASNAQGPYRLYSWRERLGEPVVELLTRALKYDMDSRHADTNEFVWEVRDILALPSVEGPTLAEVVSTVRHRLRRKRALPTGATAAMTPEELAEIANELDQPTRRSLKEPRGARPGTEPEMDEKQRWGSVARSGSRELRKSRASSSGDSRKDSLRDRLKRSGGARKSSSDARSSLRDRLKRSRGSRDDLSCSRRDLSRSGARTSRSREPEPEPPPEEKPAKKRGSSLLERLRSSKGTERPSASSSAAAEPAGTEVTVQLLDGSDCTVQVPEDALVCDAIALAAATRGGPPMSLTGTLEGWLRAEQDGEHIAGDTPISDLEAASLRLSFRRARLVPIAVEVRGDEPASFRAPVSTAVTAGAALEQILTALELDGAGWQISVGGRALPTQLALGEVLDAGSADDDVMVVVQQ